MPLNEPEERRVWPRGDAGGAEKAAVPTVSESVACIGCGYDLVGLAVAGKCPECGGVVRESLAASKGRQALRERVGGWLFVGLLATIAGDVLGTVALFLGFGPCGGTPISGLGPPLWVIGPLIGAIGFHVLGGRGRSDGLVVAAWVVPVLIGIGAGVMDYELLAGEGGGWLVVRLIAMWAAVAWAVRNHLASRVVGVMIGAGDRGRPGGAAGAGAAVSWVGAACMIGGVAMTWSDGGGLNLLAVVVGGIGLVGALVAQGMIAEGVKGIR